MKNVFYVKVPWSVLKSRVLKPTAKLVYAYLLFRCNVGGYWRGWMREISNDTGIPYGTIRKALRQLAAIGYIDIDSQLRKSDRNKRGYCRINTYQIAGPKC